MQVRDAIIECFAKVHHEEFGKQSDSEKEQRLHAEAYVRSVFSDAGADFDNPTKKALNNVIDRLAQDASIFRDQKTIQKHFEEIMSCLKRIR